jgi:hypothetical protein
MDRNTRKILNYISDMEKQAKQMSYIKHLKKEVEIGANGTQKYVVKKGPNKGKVL